MSETADYLQPAAMRRNVFVLASTQALSMSGTSLLITISALAGQMLAPSPGLTTLPLALQFMGTMATTIPASMLMAHFGRRFGFGVGQTIGMVGASVSAAAIYYGSFTLLMIGAALMGAHNAFWQYLRFAAADAADADYRPRAISYVMAGGVIAAVFGPQLAKWTAGISVYTYMASYLAVVVLSFVALVLVQAIKIPRPPRTKFSGGRPISEIAKTPVFFIAVMSSAVGYGVMNFLMTSTPLAMLFCGFTFNDSATVIQWHVLGMFAPSFFTGHLIKRFGVVNIIAFGSVLMACAVVSALAGIQFINFWGGLLVLGVGWNFMFIGGTALLTDAYAPEEKAKTQAAHDFIVFGTVAATALLSGMVHELLGWSVVNILAAPVIFAAFLGAIWYRSYAARSRPA